MDLFGLCWRYELAEQAIDGLWQRLRSSGLRLAISIWLTLVAMPALANPAEILRSGTMSDLIEQVIDTYESNGISWQHWIDWEIQPFTTTYWYYSRYENRIVVGEFPQADQIDAYWQAWSEALTDGNWNPGPFFVSEADAFEMARFNQFILATHESAHAITTRYDPNHRDRHDHDINCREYYADRLTAIILQDHASRSDDFARWSKRYRELVVSMHDAIPVEYLVERADQPTLEADCSVIEVEQPTPDKLQAYASAFFARWEALLDVEFPNVEESFSILLQDRLDARYSGYSKAPEWTGGGLETQSEFDEVFSHYSYKSRIVSDGWRRVAFAPDGRLWFAEARIGLSDGSQELLFGRVDAGGDPYRVELHWPEGTEKSWLYGIAVFNEREIYALFGNDKISVMLLRLHYEGQSWSQNAIAEWKNIGRSQLFRTPQNDLVVGLTSFYDAENDEFDDSRWELKFVDPQSGEERAALSIAEKINRLIAVDKKGRIYFGAGSVIWRYASESGFERVAGSGLWGSRDGSTFESQMSSIDAFQLLKDGTGILLDDIPGTNGRQTLRRLMPAKAQ